MGTKKKVSRSEAIRNFLAKAKGPQALADIREGIRADKDESKFIASTLIRLLADGEVSRRERPTPTGGTKWAYTLKKAAMPAPKAAAKRKAKAKPRKAAAAHAAA